MRKEEFMRQLETLLADISEEERREALSYYRSYFEDAGEENEERILRELESPQKVAATIKADLRMEQGNTSGVYTERGFEDGRFQEKKQEVEVRERVSGSQNWTREEHRADADENSTAKVIVIAIIAVLTSPIWISLLAGLFSFIVGLLGAVIGFVVAAFALYITGGVLFGVGIGEFVVGNIAAGFGLLGASLIVWVLAILMTVFCVWVCGKGIPWIFGKGIPRICDAVASLWKKIFPGKEHTV